MLGLILAVVLSNQLANDKPEYAVELYQKGMAHALAGEYGKAEQYFTEALRLEPRSEALWTYRSMARGMLGNVAGSTADWEESLKWNLESIQKQIETAFDEGDWPKLISITEWYHYRKQLSPIGCYRLGCAYRQVWREKEALQLFKLALEHEDQLGSARGYAHFCYAELILLDQIRYIKSQGIENYINAVNRRVDMLQQVIDHLDNAWSAGYRTAIVLQDRARINWLLNRKIDSICDLRKAVIHDSKSVQLRLQLIDYLNSCERWQEAQDELNWLNRLSLTPSEKTQYGEDICKLQAIASSKVAKAKPVELVPLKPEGTFSPQSLEQAWKSKEPVRPY